MTIIRCNYCNKEFETFPSRLKQGKRYCSIECKNLAQQKPEGWVERICEVCGKTYTVQRFFVENRKPRYCSKVCMNRGISESRKGEGNPNWVKKIRVTCAECGREFEVLKSARIFGQGKFCSKDCKYIYHSKHYRGPNRWNWQHGERAGVSYNGYGKEWPRISDAIRERDNWICQKCGKKPNAKNLHVHHITPFREFNGNTELANRDDNLISLCDSCHRLEDAKIRRASKS